MTTEYSKKIEEVPKFFVVFLSISASIILLLTIAQVFFSWKNWANLNHVSGAWLTLATDLYQGTFYRPLFSEATGYGGTRFFPLQFLLHAGLLHLIGNPITAGFILNIGSAISLSAGLFFLLKELKLKTYSASLFCLLLFANISFQESLTDIRGDILPVTLNVWGLVYCLRILNKRYSVVPASLCFVLAFAAKVTAIYGLIAAIVWLYFSGEKKRAIALFLYSVLGFLLVLTLIQLASNGQFIEIMAECSPGGATIETILKSPLRIAKRLLLKDMNFALACFFAAGILIWFSFPYWYLRSSLPICFLLSSFLMTLFIFGSPGTESNHFVDVHVALVFLIASSLVSPSKLGLETKYGIIVFLSLVVIVPVFQKTWDSMESDKKKNILEAVTYIEQLESEEKLILSEDPLIPVIAEKKIWLQDAFMFKIIGEKDESLAYPMQAIIKQKKFKAIVLLFDPFKGGYFQEAHFGKKTIGNFINYYHFAKKIGPYRIFLPKIDANPNDYGNG